MTTLDNNVHALVLTTSWNEAGSDPCKLCTLFLSAKIVRWLDVIESNVNLPRCPMRPAIQRGKGQPEALPPVRSEITSYSPVSTHSHYHHSPLCGAALDFPIPTALCTVPWKRMHYYLWNLPSCGYASGWWAIALLGIVDSSMFSHINIYVYYIISIQLYGKMQLRLGF